MRRWWAEVGLQKSSHRSRFETAKATTVVHAQKICYITIVNTIIQSAGKPPQTTPTRAEKH